MAGGTVPREIVPDEVLYEKYGKVTGVYRKEGQMGYNLEILSPQSTIQDRLVPFDGITAPSTRIKFEKQLQELLQSVKLPESSSNPVLQREQLPESTGTGEYAKYGKAIGLRIKEDQVEFYLLFEPPPKFDITYTWCPLNDVSHLPTRIRFEKELLKLLESVKLPPQPNQPSEGTTGEVVPAAAFSAGKSPSPSGESIYSSGENRSDAREGEEETEATSSERDLMEGAGEAARTQPTTSPVAASPAGQLPSRIESMHNPLLEEETQSFIRSRASKRAGSGNVEPRGEVYHKSQKFDKPGQSVKGAEGEAATTSPVSSNGGATGGAPTTSPVTASSAGEGPSSSEENPLVGLVSMASQILSDDEIEVDNQSTISTSNGKKAGSPTKAKKNSTEDVGNSGGSGSTGERVDTSEGVTIRKSGRTAKSLKRSLADIDSAGGSEDEEGDGFDFELQARGRNKKGNSGRSRPKTRCRGSTPMNRITRQSRREPPARRSSQPDPHSRLATGEAAQKPRRSAPVETSSADETPSSSGANEDNIQEIIKEGRRNGKLTYWVKVKKAGSVKFSFQWIEATEASDQLVISFREKQKEMNETPNLVGGGRRVEPEKFSCDICGKEFGNKNNLSQHKLLKHPPPEWDKVWKKSCISRGNSWFCKWKEGGEKCPKVEKDEYTIRRHIITAHLKKTGKNFSCPHCLHKFATTATLRRHLCRVVPTVPSLRDHARTAREPPVVVGKRIVALQNAEKLFVCSECNHGVMNYASLRLHIKAKHKRSPNKVEKAQQYYPGKCPIPVISKTNVVAAGVGRFLCQVCRREFGSPKQVTEHCRKAHPSNPK